MLGVWRITHSVPAWTVALRCPEADLTARMACIGPAIPVLEHMSSPHESSAPTRCAILRAVHRPDRVADSGVC